MVGAFGQGFRSGSAGAGWLGEIDQAFGKVHAEDFGGWIEAAEEGSGEGDQGLGAGAVEAGATFGRFGAFGAGAAAFERGAAAVVESDDEKGACGVETAAAVGAGGELDVLDDADELLAIEEGAADEIADVGGTVFERGAVFGGDEEVEAGEEFGVRDRGDAGDGENDAAFVAAVGHPGFGDGAGPRLLGGTGEADLREMHAGAAGQLLRKVGEQLGEKLAFAALGPEQMREGYPLHGQGAPTVR